MLYQPFRDLRKPILGGLLLLLMWPARAPAQEEMVTTTDIVAYISALTICLKEEGYANSEQAAAIGHEMLEEYGNKNGITLDRMYRIMQGKHFRARALDVVRTVGGCEALIDKKKRKGSTWY